MSSEKPMSECSPEPKVSSEPGTSSDREKRSRYRGMYLDLLTKTSITMPDLEVMRDILRTLDGKTIPWFEARLPRPENLRQCRLQVRYPRRFPVVFACQNYRYHDYLKRAIELTTKLPMDPFWSEESSVNTTELAKDFSRVGPNRLLFVYLGDLEADRPPEKTWTPTPLVVARNLEDRTLSIIGEFDGKGKIIPDYDSAGPEAPDENFGYCNIGLRQAGTRFQAGTRSSNLLQPRTGWLKPCSISTLGIDRNTARLLPLASVLKEMQNLWSSASLAYSFTASSGDLSQYLQQEYEIQPKDAKFLVDRVENISPRRDMPWTMLLGAFDSLCLATTDEELNAIKIVRSYEAKPRIRWRIRGQEVMMPFGHSHGILHLTYHGIPQSASTVPNDTALTLHVESSSPTVFVVMAGLHLRDECGIWCYSGLILAKTLHAIPSRQYILIQDPTMDLKKALDDLEGLEAVLQSYVDSSVAWLEGFKLPKVEDPQPLEIQECPVIWKTSRLEGFGPACRVDDKLKASDWSNDAIDESTAADSSIT
ncbi:MAG: hypothetical protein Q9167_004055 [Letrouitia subvulpina]